MLHKLQISLIVLFIILFNAANAQEGGEQLPFVRGNRIIFQDNFEKDGLGDFPAFWNSNGTGSVKIPNGFNKKFLLITENSVVNPQLKKPLPENFTIEFDLLILNDPPIRMASFGFGNKPFTVSNMLAPKDGIVFSLHSNNHKYSEGLKYGTQKFSSSDFKLKTQQYATPLNKIINVGISVNGKRIRLYLDGQKKLDMPTSFDESFRKSFFFNATVHGSADSKLNYFYISNLIIAEAGLDKRSEVIKDLFEKGRASTTAIQFNNNSSILTAQSNTIVTELANAMKENQTVKIKIIGHTDDNGDDKSNITLSKKRAEAVKLALIKQGIAASRLQSDGKGETEPVADNSTIEGKSANRRVEFIKY